MRYAVLNYSLYFIFIYLPLFINLLNFPLLVAVSLPFLSLSKDSIESKTQEGERERDHKLRVFAESLSISAFLPLLRPSQIRDPISHQAHISVRIIA